MVVLKSKQFVLRPLKKEDAEDIARNINCPIIARNTSRIPYPYTLKDAKTWLAKTLKENRKKKRTKVNFAIEIDGEVVGSISLEDIKGHKAEIGYWLGEKYWGRGIMTEAVKLVTRFGFRELKLRRIYAFVFCFNKASKRVLEKAGYNLEGVLRKHYKKGKRFIDVYLLAKVR